MLFALAAAASLVDRQRALVAEAGGRCRRGRAGEIVVCGRSDQERSPYRLPLIPGEDGFRIDGPANSVARERHQLMDVGGAGAQAGACGAAGAAGQVGCMVKGWKEADEQRGYRRPQR